MRDCESERVRSGSQLLSDSQTFFYFFFEFRAPHPPLMRTRGTATTPRRLQVQ